MRDTGPPSPGQAPEPDHALGLAALDALPAHIAVLDATGTIVAVNRAWLQFARDNGDPRPQSLARGANYLDVCRRTAGPEADEAQHAAGGIEAVLRGEQASFAMEYPCHSPSMQRWFLMHVVPLQPGPGGAVVSHFDISARRSAEEALRQSKEYAEHILDVAGVIFVVLDREGRITKLNRKGCEVLGCTEAAVLGQGWIEVFVPQRLRAEVHRVLERVLAGDLADATHFENPVCARDGQERLIAWHNAVLRDSHGAIVGTLSSGDDITDERRALEALRETDRRKDEFLAMLGHELRNPLVPLRNAVQVLRRLVAPGDPQRWALDLIDRQVATMVRLIDDLLDVSRVLRGLVTLRPEPLELGEVVRRALESAEPLLAARGHQLELGLAREPLRVDGDPVRLAQVIVNLLDNAAKYTDAGGRVWLTVERHGAEAAIRVRDTGMGISPSLLPRIFEPFEQGARTLDRAQGGLGIGLALVRRVVELHGGRIEAHSPGPGQGAEFLVWLPLAEPAAPVRQAEPAPSPAAAGPGLRVLVVDDDPAVAESTAVLLQLDAHEVATAASGPEALALAATFHPQVALLDIGLKGMDGYELASRLRRQTPGHEGLLLVAVSGYGHAAAVSQSITAGFDLHLVKPVPPEELTAVLARHAAALGDRGQPAGGRDPVP
jgi:PAS domain S-box-containing protein